MYFQTAKNDTVLNNQPVNEIIKQITTYKKRFKFVIANVEQMKFRLHLIRSASAEGYKYIEE